MPHKSRSNKHATKEELEERKVWDFLNNTYNMEELGPCNKEYRRWKKCLILVESRFEYCRKEEYSFRRCEAINLTNLEFLLKHNIDPTNYIRHSQRMVGLYDQQLYNRDYNPGYPWDEVDQ